MTNQEIIEDIRSLCRGERQVTATLLRRLVLAERRRVYLDVSRTSMYSWLTRDLGYSNSSAQRRLEAARLLNRVPDAFIDFESGLLNLTNLAYAQTLIARAERRRGSKFSSAECEAVVAALKGKNSIEGERELVLLFPDEINPGGFDSVHAIGPSHVRVIVTCPREFTEMLERVRELLSHVLPFGSTGELIVEAMARFAEYEEKNTTAPVDGCVKASFAKIRRQLMARSGGRCEWVDEVTGTRCPGRYRLEIDHIIPRAKGGTDEFENLRVLCRAHNLRAAENEFGKEKMDNYRRDA